ncbi:MAG: D-glycero-beta-D-manno-heptose 1,7-bisphosphate 7-phosphatase [Gammaproteobacteria bacterium]|nr:D-glycero-beta-D-manno-heptose 1,7-bisphosphate 7-phosphatase [Gammaproteobacteria bacterium]
MKTIILDRDGVINEDSDDFIKSPDEWVPITGSLDAVARLNHAGYQVYVASNQSGIGRGLFDIESLNAIHQKMNTELQKIGGRIQAILFCPHAPDEECQCRKPKAGLYEEVARRSQEPLINMPVIGDSFRDLEAAMTVGAKPILVLTGKGENTLMEHREQLLNVPRFANLAVAVERLLDEAAVKES